MEREERAKASSKAMPSIVFCAETAHTAGAWMYAFRGFLTLLSRARSELPAGTRIEAAILCSELTAPLCLMRPRSATSLDWHWARLVDTSSRISLFRFTSLLCLEPAGARRGPKPLGIITAPKT